MARDTSYLILHGNQWVVRVKVPANLRDTFGKAHLKHALHTDSLILANRLKHEHIARFKQEIAKAAAALRRKAGLSADPEIKEALQWREHYSRSSRKVEVRNRFEDGTEFVDSEKGAVENAIVDRAMEIEERHGLTAAKAFHEVATGIATPIFTQVDRWLSEVDMKPRQKIDYRRAILKFDTWLPSEGHIGNIEPVTRKIAGQYIHKAFSELRVNERTANKDISCLSSFWRWLERRGIAQENVWRGQSLPKSRPDARTDKRPFSDDEVRLLLGGTPQDYLKDMMLIAALSGLRIEEIARLDVSSVAEGSFYIREGKTKASIRRFPIHTSLAELIGERCAGKQLGDALFNELPVPKAGSAIERSQKAVKAFTIYRRRQGVDEVPEGFRQSRVDFHSFRRWFITKAEQAGQQPHIISAVVGHGRAGMTLGRYSGGPSIEQMRAVIESVQLPELTPQVPISAATSSGTSP